MVNIFLKIKIFINGLKIDEAKNKIIDKLENNKLGRRKVNFKLRDWGISRQRFWGCPIPIIYREDGEVLAVEDAELPIKLPDIKNFSENNEIPKDCCLNIDVVVHLAA